MSDATSRVLIIDGEGPLVLKDLARDMAAKIHTWYEPFVSRYLYFDTLSLFNAFLAESGRDSNQPGDTLALLVPHLLAYGVCDDELREEATRTVVAPGADNLIQALKQEGWEIRVISSAYSALWEIVGPRLGISPEQIASSKVSLDELRERIRWSEFLSNFVKSTERIVISDKDDIEFAQHRYKKSLHLIC